MKHADFSLGMVFYSAMRAPQPYIVTDIGQLVIVASHYVLPSDRDELGEWMECVFQPREFPYCSTEEPPNASHSNRDDEARQREERARVAAEQSIPQGELFG